MGKMSVKGKWKPHEGKSLSDEHCIVTNHQSVGTKTSEYLNRIRKVEGDLVMLVMDWQDPASTGKSLSDALIFASTNPQYDHRLFIELQVQYMKISSLNLGRTCCAQKMFLTFRTIFVHNMFSSCCAKRRASDKDLPVLLVNQNWNTVDFLELMKKH